VTTWAATGAGFVSKSYEKTLNKKHNIFIYARGNKRAKNDPNWDNLNVTWAESHPVSTGLNRTHFSSWVKKNKIDAIIFNEQRHWEGVILAKKLGVLTGAYVDYYTADTVPLFNLYDFLICNTKRHFGVFQNHNQVCYCPWGTNIKEFKPTASITTRPITFVISAGWDGEYANKLPWMDRRGTGISIRAFQKIKSPECRLLIYSQAPLKRCPEEWQKNILNDKRINFIIGTYVPFPYYQGDIYIYPSRLDGIGLTLPEALSCGLPAITTDSAPMNEFVFDGFNGKTVSVKEFRGRPDGYYWPESICDEESLVDAMNFYISNPELVKEHGYNARQFSEEKLNWEENSRFLCEWIPSLKSNLSIESNAFKSLESDAIAYDYLTNPKPLESIRAAVNSLIYISFKNFKKSLNL
jgi:1,2-diacylglycerol 3-alpha-glucosyltransferase